MSTPTESLLRSTSRSSSPSDVESLFRAYFTFRSLPPASPLAPPGVATLLLACLSCVSPAWATPLLRLACCGCLWALLRAAHTSRARARLLAELRARAALSAKQAALLGLPEGVAEEEGAGGGGATPHHHVPELAGEAARTAAAYKSGGGAAFPTSSSPPPRGSLARSALRSSLLAAVDRTQRLEEPPPSPALHASARGLAPASPASSPSYISAAAPASSRRGVDVDARRFAASGLGRSPLAASSSPAFSPATAAASRPLALILRHTQLSAGDLDRLAGGLKCVLARHFRGELQRALATNTQELAAANSTLPLAWLERRSRRALLPCLLLQRPQPPGGLTLDEVLAIEAPGQDSRYACARRPAAAAANLWAERAELEAFLCPRRYVATAAAAAAAAAAGGSASAAAAAEVDPVLYGALRLACLTSDDGMSGYAGDHRADEGALAGLGPAGAAYAATRRAAQLAAAAPEQQEEPQEEEAAQAAATALAAAAMLPPLPSDAELLLNYAVTLADVLVAEAANADAAASAEPRRCARGGRPWTQSDALFAAAVMRRGLGVRPAVAGLHPAGAAALIAATTAAAAAAEGGGAQDEAAAAAAAGSVHLVIPVEAPALTALITLGNDGDQQTNPRDASARAVVVGARVTLDPGNDLTSRVALPRALGLVMQLLLQNDGGRVGGVPAKAALTRMLGGTAGGGQADKERGAWGSMFGARLV